MLTRVENHSNLLLQNASSLCLLLLITIIIQMIAILGLAHVSWKNSKKITKLSQETSVNQSVHFENIHQVRENEGGNRRMRPPPRLAPNDHLVANP